MVRLKFRGFLSEDFIFKEFGKKLKKCFVLLLQSEIKKWNKLVFVIHYVVVDFSDVTLHSVELNVICFLIEQPIQVFLYVVSWSCHCGK